MKNLYQSILDLPREHWDYYFEINKNNQMAVPFTNSVPYTEFIYNFFQRGGKVKVFETSGIEPSRLYRPNHICSVFFLGLLIYYGTSLHKRFPLGQNKPAYDKFPFIWFLISLFHDNACQMELDERLSHIGTIAALKRHFQIEHDLLRLKPSACKHLIASRTKYFRYCRQHRNRLDHGIVGGMLLYDRLVKIRRRKQVEENMQEQLFWDKSLESDYRQAAHAISLHNIWLPGPDYVELYQKYGLTRLVEAPLTTIAEFPLYYILAVVDTIEPLKEFMAEYSDDYILKQLQITFRPDGISLDNLLGSTLEISRITRKAQSLQHWLAIQFQERETGFDLNFLIDKRNNH